MGWNLVYQEQSSYEDRSGIAVAVSRSRTDLLVSGNGQSCIYSLLVHVPQSVRQHLCICNDYRDR